MSMNKPVELDGHFPQNESLANDPGRSGHRDSVASKIAVDYTQFVEVGDGLDTRASLRRDGSITVSLNLKRKVPNVLDGHATEVKEFGVDKSGWRNYPKMNIVVMIVGSRGDVQPYVALGKRLLQDGHRIRIASHEMFRSFVEESELEFVDIGGDPKELMSYMVKNPGLIPGIESLKNGDISKKRKMLAEMMDGCWRSCHSPCPRSGRTFAADAIISNPPAFAHVHCAEALGIPLLMSFTMPWSPTTEFQHPLVNIQESNAQKGLTNYLSYALADIMTWQGLGDIVNSFRIKALDLKPLSNRSGAGILETVKVPWTYCMSPTLVPKPKDWKNYIDVVGFYFLDLATKYTPSKDLDAFLAAGEPPIYVGFGSVVVDDPVVMTNIVFEATRQAGVRALVSAGWGGLGGFEIPPHVFVLGNIPHDWLFDKGRVAAAVHHGGAGTTAIGLSKGLPTVVVPFFGDQAFWGNMIHRSGAGPAPIPHKDLTVENLRDAIMFAVSPPAKAAAAQMADQIRKEDGVGAGVISFYEHLPLKNMRCDLDPSRLAVWWSSKYCLKLSAFAAQVLLDAGKLNISDLVLHRSKEYHTKRSISDPLTGSASAMYWFVSSFCSGLVHSFTSPREGLIETTASIPKGTMKIISSVYHGFHNAPLLYGSEVREPGPVTSFSSGLKEAGKGLYFGTYDAITGLVREPWEGAQKESLKGAVKGSARGVVNSLLRPAAGLVGVVKHPMKGAVKSIQARSKINKVHVQYNTRVSDGVAAVQSSTKAERDAVLEKFEQSKATVRKRQDKHTKMAGIITEEDDSAGRVDPSVSSVTTSLPPIHFPNNPPSPSLQSTGPHFMAPESVGSSNDSPIPWLTPPPVSWNACPPTRPKQLHSSDLDVQSDRSYYSTYVPLSCLPDSSIPHPHYQALTSLSLPHSGFMNASGSSSYDGPIVLSPSRQLILTQTSIPHSSPLRSVSGGSVDGSDSSSFYNSSMISLRAPLASSPSLSIPSSPLLRSSDSPGVSHCETSVSVLSDTSSLQSAPHFRSMDSGFTDSSKSYSTSYDFSPPTLQTAGAPKSIYTSDSVLIDTPAGGKSASLSVRPLPPPPPYTPTAVYLQPSDHIMQDLQNESCYEPSVSSQSTYLPSPSPFFGARSSHSSTPDLTNVLERTSFYDELYERDLEIAPSLRSEQ